MHEYLTIGEIERRFDAEWVLLSEPEVDERDQVIAGTVIIHSKSRDEVDRKAVELKLPETAFLYTGEIPDDAAVVL